MTTAKQLVKHFIAEYLWKMQQIVMATNTYLARLSALHDLVDGRLHSCLYKFSARHPHVLIHQRCCQRVGSEQCRCRI